MVRDAIFDASNLISIADALAAAAARCATLPRGSGAAAAAAHSAYWLSVRKQTYAKLSAEMQTRLDAYEREHGVFLCPLLAVEGFDARLLGLDAEGTPAARGFYVVENLCALKARNAQTDRNYVPPDDAVMAARPDVAVMQMPFTSSLAG